MLTSSLDILEKSQLSAHQAKGILRVMELELAARDGSLASKADLAALRSDMEMGFARLEAKFDVKIESIRTEIQSIKTEFFRLLLTAMVGQTSIMLGALYFFLNYARK